MERRIIVKKKETFVYQKGSRNSLIFVTHASFWVAVRGQNCRSAVRPKFCCRNLWLLQYWEGWPLLIRRWLEGLSWKVDLVDWRKSLSWSKGLGCLIWFGSKGRGEFLGFPLEEGFFPGWEPTYCDTCCFDLHAFGCDSCLMIRR